MKIIRANKGQGKTTELIRRSNKEWKYIICADMKRVEIITKMARDLGLDIPFPIMVRELPFSPKNRIQSVLIDDFEDVLQMLVGKNIDCVTTSCEIVPIKRKN